jgi:hypothetical protein
LSHDRRVAWLSAEGPGVVRELERPPADGDAGGVVPSVLGVVRFEGGHRVGAAVLGTCHPHGSALHWRDQAAVNRQE